MRIRGADIAWPMAMDLLQQIFPARVSAEPERFEAVRQAVDHLETAGADRSGRSQDDDASSASCSLGGFHEVAPGTEAAYPYCLFARNPLAILDVRERSSEEYFRPNKK